MQGAELVLGLIGKMNSITKSCIVDIKVVIQHKLRAWQHNVLLI